jgi:hypothetical protein
MNIRLTNGVKTITRAKDQYEANINSFKIRGFVPVGEVKKEIKKATVKDISDKVVQLKTKKRKTRKKK